MATSWRKRKKWAHEDLADPTFVCDEHDDSSTGEDERQKRQKVETQRSAEGAEPCVLCTKSSSSTKNPLYRVDANTLQFWCSQWLIIPAEWMSPGDEHLRSLAINFQAAKTGGSRLPAHKLCRDAVANKGRLEDAFDRAKKGKQAKEALERTRRAREEEARPQTWHDGVLPHRSQAAPPVRPTCIICTKDARHGKLHLVESEGVAQCTRTHAEMMRDPKFMCADETYMEAAVRIVTVRGDMHAAEVHMHDKCRRIFLSVNITKRRQDEGNQVEEPQAMDVDANPAEDVALGAVCAWLRVKLEGGCGTVKLAECEKIYRTHDPTLPDRVFARKRDKLVRRYNAEMADGDENRICIQIPPGGVQQGYYICTLRAASEWAPVVHQQEAQILELEEYVEADRDLRQPALDEGQILHWAAQILGKHITDVPPRVGGVPTPDGLGREEAIRSAGGPIVHRFFCHLLQQGKVAKKGVKPGSDADKRALSLMADNALAVTGIYQPKHLAGAFVLRTKGGYAATDFMAAMGNLATARHGAEVSGGVGW